LESSTIFEFHMNSNSFSAEPQRYILQVTYQGVCRLAAEFHKTGGWRSTFPRRYHPTAMRNVKRLVCTGIVGLALGLTSSARAQSDPPFDPAIDVNLFEYAVGPKSFLTVADADLANKDQFNVDFLLTFLTDPFTVYDVTADGEEIIGERVSVVEGACGEPG